MSQSTYTTTSNYGYNGSSPSYYMPTDFTSTSGQFTFGSQTSSTMTIMPPPSQVGNTGVSFYYSGVRRQAPG